MLRNWYLKLLEDARQEGIVVSVTNLYDEYFARAPNLCACRLLVEKGSKSVALRQLKRFSRCVLLSKPPHMRLRKNNEKLPPK